MANELAGRRMAIPWRPIGWGIAAAVILAPLVAMQFTRDVNWTAGDFAFAIVMIGGVGLLFELAVRASVNWAYRGGAALALAAGFLTIWVNAAVGIIGNEDNPLNLVFMVVVALAIAGSIVAGAKAALMERAMAVAAAAQALIGIVVFASDVGASDPPGPVKLLILIEAFAALWLASALLFKKAAYSSTSEA
jgi:hypothetical protein